jgi:hypothetical protein
MEKMRWEKWSKINALMKSSERYNQVGALWTL